MTFAMRPSPPKEMRVHARNKRPSAGTSLVLLAFWGWVVAMQVRGALRWDHVAVAVLATALAFGPPAARRFYRGVLPLGLVGLFYDAMRFVEHLGVSESTVHVCDLRALELAWFGITSGGERMTLHDWLQPRATLVFDAICAIPYGAFLLVVFGYCFFLFIRDFEAQQRFAWAFFGVNLVGFATYHLYPAAPPWYFHRYGCTVDLSAAASAGPNLMRVDALLGVPYFAGLYGRASDVFGAFPSLHVAYPTLMLAVGWRVHGRLGRALLALFLTWMSMSAVYLDHHWVIDIVAGIAYGLAAAYAARRLAPVFTARPATPRGASLRTETGGAAG
jgi:inositol phosphorylceramide synthase catalytic subunit